MYLLTSLYPPPPHTPIGWTFTFYPSIRGIGQYFVAKIVSIISPMWIEYYIGGSQHFLARVSIVLSAIVILSLFCGHFFVNKLIFLFFQRKRDDSEAFSILQRYLESGSEFCRVPNTLFKYIILKFLLWLFPSVLNMIWNLDP